MVLDTCLAAAFKRADGRYDAKNFTLFEIDKIKEVCSSLEVNLYKNKMINLKIGCPLCGETHSYKYNIDDFIKRDMIIGGCETLGMPIFFIGNPRNVEKVINKYQQFHSRLCVMI